nr:nucleotidyltransferase family protein [uncultured Solibaculum sp.]
MKIVGIVAEYNPFHYGHVHHIMETRKNGATHIVAVMSGHFVQRGEPSVVSKFARAKMALQNGVDLVLELPLPWSMSSAEGFAFGAMSLLQGLGCVEGLSFGSECGNIERLKQAALACDHPDVLRVLPHYLDQGLPFPSVRQKAVSHALGEDIADVLQSPNDQLGVEYLRASRRIGWNVQPMCIPRMGVQHDQDSTHCRFASASLLRRWMTKDGLDKAKPFLPSSSFAILKHQWDMGAAPASIENIDRCVLARLRNMTAEELKSCPDVSEGLERRILKEAKTAKNLPTLYDAVKTKRYTHSRIRRICMAAFLQLPAGMTKQCPPMLRILGMNRRGQEILSVASRKAALPIVTRAKELLGLEEFAAQVSCLERTAGNLWGLCTPSILPCDMDLTAKLLVEKESLF